VEEKSLSCTAAMLYMTCEHGQMKLLSVHVPSDRRGSVAPFGIGISFRWKLLLQKVRLSMLEAGGNTMILEDSTISL